MHGGSGGGPFGVAGDGTSWRAGPLLMCSARRRDPAAGQGWPSAGRGESLDGIREMAERLALSSFSRL